METLFCFLVTAIVVSSCIFLARLFELKIRKNIEVYKYWRARKLAAKETANYYRLLNKKRHLAKSDSPQW